MCALLNWGLVSGEGTILKLLVREECFPLDHKLFTFRSSKIPSDLVMYGRVRPINLVRIILLVDLEIFKLIHFFK